MEKFRKYDGGNNVPPTKEKILVPSLSNIPEKKKIYIGIPRNKCITWNDGISCILL